MYSWESFQKTLPTLHLIESSWQVYLSCKSVADLCNEAMGTPQPSGQDRTNELREQVEGLVQSLSEEVYFWHFPFYQGDFLELTEALHAGGKSVQEEATKVARDRFRNFMKSIPTSSRASLSNRISTPSHRRTSVRLLRELAQTRQEMAGLISHN